MTTLSSLLQEIQTCHCCAAQLPFAPKPIFRARTTARLLIVGQAPGIKVHETGIPWNDASGNRLRDWLRMDRETFYDDTQIAIIPTGFCYPGKDKHGGDLPPRPECAPLWHPVLLSHLPNIQLKLLIGQYAQCYYLSRRMKTNVTDTVRAWESYLPDYFPLPHPSPRNQLWLTRNPWFAEEVLPVLQQRVTAVLATL